MVHLCYGKNRKGWEQMTKEQFKAKAKEIIDNEPFANKGKLFEYESFIEMRVAFIPDGLGSAKADMPLEEFLDKIYEQIKESLK